MRKIVSLLLTFISVAAYSQTNFVFSPEKPKPGDVITFTYEPAGDIANTTIPIEAVVYQNGAKSSKADDLILKKVANKYTGTLQTDTAAAFIYFGFSADQKNDNNFNEGYTITLYENDQPRKGANFQKAIFYQYRGSQVGVETSNEKALAAFNEELTLYPASKKEYLYSYARLQASMNKDEAAKIYLKEIESLLKEGLKAETDYQLVQNLYEVAKFPEQAKMIASIKKEKFPSGDWRIEDEVNNFTSEKDLDKKKQLLDQLMQKAENGGDKWSWVRSNGNYYKSMIARTYMAKKDWPNFKKAVAESGVTDKMQLAGLYNSAAWAMQESNDNLPLAEEFSWKATQLAKEEWKNPTGKKPDYYTQKQWLKNNEYMYAMYADTYGMVEYRLGNYKKGLTYAKESAITLNKGKDADQNNTYALLAEKALPQKQYVKALEQFVKDGKSTGEIKEILKRAYVKSKKSEEGFEDYITTLQKESQLKMLAELRKSMLDQTAPSFALLNLEGKKIDIADLKGKVVVVDFWATWCGPCKASFPGMQKAVTKYKDDPNVKFIFVDTWERGDDKKKNAAEFITSNKYTFDVLMDDEDKVVEQFKVDGIPTKFVIDKDGKIRFKAVGFDGSDDKLVSELTAMIEMAGDPGKKAF